MKKRTLYILITIFIFVFVILLLERMTGGHPADIFRETVYYLDFNAEEVQCIDVWGTPPQMKNPDEGYGTYTDYSKKEKICSYLKTIPFVEVKRSEFPNMSPCGGIGFKCYKSELNKSVSVYGPSFISHPNSDKLYRVKYECVDIISGLEELDL